MTSFEEVARSLGLTTDFPDAVNAEVARLLANPGIDDPALIDLERLPFVTVDGAGTRDLDQAFFVERTPGGFHLLYAIADAAHYVAPGSALLTEALERGSSFYLPGFSVPMLPRQLSEGLISLNEGEARRALVFDVDLDDDATVKRFELSRARIRSRKKLSFEEVDDLVRAPDASPHVNAPYRACLEAFVDLGDRRGVHTDRKKMVRYRRAPAEITLRPDGTLATSSDRGRVELATEQISILCNALGAQFLEAGDPDAIQPVYRVHAPPDPERLAGFERLVSRVAKKRGLPDDPWVYRRAASIGLAGYLDALPTEGAPGRLARALHLQAMLLNGQSVFASEPSPHFGVAESLYSRFTAPMREVVGIFCHKEALERLGKSRHQPREADEAMRLQVIDVSNRAKQVQRQIDREVEREIVRVVLRPDVAAPVGERPLRTGTVMSIGTGGATVHLDDIPIDVRVSFRDQGAELGGMWLSVVDDGAALVGESKRSGPTSGEKREPVVVCYLGDQVRVRAASSEGVVIVRS